MPVFSGKCFMVRFIFIDSFPLEKVAVMDYTKSVCAGRPVSITSESTVFEGKRLRVRTLQIKRDQKVEQWETVERVLKPGLQVHGVYVIAIVTYANRPKHLVLERQYRLPVDRFVLEFPGGFMEPDESPADTAKRELLEETGLTASKVLSVSDCKCTEGAPVMFNLCHFVTVLVDGDAQHNQNPICMDTNEIEVIKMSLVPLEQLELVIGEAVKEDVLVMSELYSFSQALNIQTLID